MEQIIANLLKSDSESIKRASSELQEAYNKPETILVICDIIVSSKEPQIRQYAAVLLRKRLAKLRNWQMVSQEQQQIIKQGMLNALVNEPEKPVRNAVAQFVGVLIKHESNKPDSWMNDVLKFVYGLCSSSDPKQSELGSSIFTVLADTAPDQFVPHIESVCEMFTAALLATEASGNMATPVMYNILQGMASLVPFILGHNGAEHTYQRAIPLIVKSLLGFAVQNKEKFIQAFDILENLACYTPKLLTSNIKLLLDFCLETSMNANLDSSVRVKTVSYIGWLVKLKKKTIIKQKLIEPIIQVVFTLMTIAPEDDDDDEDYFLGEDSSNPMTTATQTMDLLALHIPPEKLIPPLLQLLDPALKGNDPSHKRAAYLCMAVITEGCSETICEKYLPPLLDTVKIGITDPNPIVRNAAFFALGQFSEHLQPEISKFAPDVLPILFEFLQQLCNELKNGAAEPKHVDRMFYALETYCENLEENLVPHLPILMEKLFQTLDANNSVRLRELTLSAVSATANAAKSNMLPYFSNLIEVLKPYLVKTDNEDICALRPQAIDTLAALSRTIGKENFMPLANDTMNFSLTLLEDTDDPDLRRSLYNLIAALSEVLNEAMAPILEKVIEKLFDSVLSTEEVIPEFKDEDVIDVPTKGKNDENLDKEIDIEHSDGEDDDDFDNIAGYSVENSYLDEKEEAILALKEFAEYTGAAFIPYLQTAYQNVFKIIDHPQVDIRKVSIHALTSFIIALFKQNDSQGASNAVAILIPKLEHTIKEDEECTVALAALDSFAEILKELKQIAIPTEEIRNIIFSCIHDVLCGKVACQFDEPNSGEDQEDESEYDEALIESAGNLLPFFGHALTPDQFAMYFGRICPILLQKIEKARNNDDLKSQRSFAYGALSECFSPLQNYTETFFDTLLPVFLMGVQDKSEQVRQNSVFGLGELILYAEEKSYQSYPQVLTTLSNSVSKETHQGTLDNICGAIARLIINNCNLIPLEQVLPVLIKHLPLKDDYDENTAVFKSFKVLYIQGKEIIIQYIEQILAIGLHVLYKKQYKDQETYDIIINFLKEVREKFSDKFLNVVSSNVEIANFVQTL